MNLYALAERCSYPLVGRRLAPFCAEFLIFGLREAQACLFAGSFLTLLAISRHISIPGLARYDLLFIGGLAIQGVLLALRLESPRDVAILSLFHLLASGWNCSRPPPPSAAGATPSHRCCASPRCRFIAASCIRRWRAISCEPGHC